MAYSSAIHARGVCGNFRFKFFTITNAATSNSVVKTDMQGVDFVGSTNESDNADNFQAQKLAWAGTCDANTVNELEDTSETFVPEITGLPAYATSGANDGGQARVEYQSTDTDNLLLTNPGSKAAKDLFPAGTETYVIQEDKHIMLTPATASDDGTLLVIGR